MSNKRWCSVLMAGFLLLSLSRSAWSAPVSMEDSPNIIIITLAGVRNIDSVGDPTHQYMPHLFGEMSREGVVYTDLVAKNLEFHAPAICAIITGRTQYLDVPLRFPTVYQYLRKQFHWPASKVWVSGSGDEDKFFYTGKGWGQDTLPDRIHGYEFRLSPELQNLFDDKDWDFIRTWQILRNHYHLSWISWASGGRIQYDMFKKVMKASKPKFVHSIMYDVEVAHTDTFSSYVLALKKCDQNIYEIWQMIQSDPYYKDRTYLFVSPDHERNPYYAQHSTNAYDDPSHVWLYMFGPDVKKGVTIDRSMYHVDIFATVVQLLKLKTHAHEGHVLKDAFVKPMGRGN